jgi:hypothetical protein
VFVVAVSLVSVRLALFAGFLILFFGGHPAIQFLPRHYFPFEFITWVALAFLADRCAALALSRSHWRPPPGAWRRAAVFAAAGVAALAIPLWALRAYQDRAVKELLRAYTQAAIGAPLARTAPGVFSVERPNTTAALSAADALSSIGRTRARLMEVVVAPAACQPGTAISFKYDSTHKSLDYSRTIALDQVVRRASGPTSAGPTRIFEPVFDAFTGVDVTDPSPQCVERVGAVQNVDRFPILISAVLPSDWQTRPQYQHLVIR